MDDTIFFYKIQLERDNREKIMVTTDQNEFREEETEAKQKHIGTQAKPYHRRLSRHRAGSDIPQTLP
ncbi:hypothetical protein E2562_036720 [Oryza meyeriana var. granulata]|uniref:Uncharacterized protein n=1 Tax=Oryza meyeriana var. granulata TaxID=110450 RepID=A0A6G1DAP5_9ORYZ|nr:hypothetical protein E2562_036720 [Oryza meyeriana var. granulata]